MVAVYDTDLTVVWGIVLDDCVLSGICDVVVQEWGKRLLTGRSVAVAYSKHVIALDFWADVSGEQVTWTG